VTDLPVISIEYRLAPEHPFPAGLQDCFNSLLWIMENSRKLVNVAPDRGNFWIAGDSAGGNLAAVTCFLFRDHVKKNPSYPSRLKGQVLIYPVANLDLKTEAESRKLYGKLGEEKILTGITMRQFEEWYITKPEDRENPLVSPVFQRDLAGLPPALVITAELDILRDEGELLGKIYKEQGGLDVQVKRIKGAFHGVLTFPCLEGQQVAQLISQFVKGIPLANL